MTITPSAGAGAGPGSGTAACARAPDGRRGRPGLESAVLPQGEGKRRPKQSTPSLTNTINIYKDSFDFIVFFQLD